MSASDRIAAGNSGLIRVMAGEDRFGEHSRLGTNVIDFKVCPQDSSGIFIIEVACLGKGGPARHLHYDQDEWFYPVDGEFIFEVGQERFALGPGDSLLAPRRVPHAWAYVGPARGKLLIAFNPAGKMEGFFRVVGKTSRMPTQDSELWRAHGMEWLGLPLDIE